MSEWAKRKRCYNPELKSTLFAQVDGEAFEFECDGEAIEVFRKGSVPTLFGPFRGKPHMGPPAKLKSGSFNSRWPRRDDRGGRGS